MSDEQWALALLMFGMGAISGGTVVALIFAIGA